MSDSIIVAIIAGTMSLAGTIVTVISSNIIQSKKNAVKEAEREIRQIMRLDNIDSNMNRLEKKVDEHNGYAERFGDIQKDIAVIKNDISYLKGEK